MAKLGGEFYVSAPGRPNPSTVSPSILTACQIAKAFRGNVPSVEGLQTKFGMSRATAYRWRAAFKLAWGQE